MEASKYVMQIKSFPYLLFYNIETLTMFSTLDPDLARFKWNLISSFGVFYKGGWIKKAVIANKLKTPTALRIMNSKLFELIL